MDQANKRIIPVVYATDANYMPYTAISMWSAVKNVGPDTVLRFIIAVPQNFSDEVERQTTALFAKWDNCTLEFLRMGSEFDDVEMKITHITTPTYYRLLLAELLPECDKCIYLDGDTIINCDLNEMYDADMDGMLIGGTIAQVVWQKPEHHMERLEWNRDIPFKFVNAGVLVMNLAEIRKQDMTKVFLKLMDKNFPGQDQDIINVACAGRIQLLPFRYNVASKYCNWDIQKFAPFYDLAEELEGFQNPAIIHYADKIKPWADAHTYYGKEWLEMAFSDELWDYYGHSHMPELIEMASTPELRELRDKTRDQERTIRSLESDKRSLEKQIRSLEREKEKQQRKNEKLEKKMADITDSASFKLGRAITWFPRKFRGLLRRIKKKIEA